MPYRFYETLSAARIPVVISNDYILPFEDEIPYDQFIVRVPTDQAYRADEYIMNYFSSIADDQELIDRGKMGRQYWLKYLSWKERPEPEVRRLMEYAIRKKMHQLGLLPAEELMVLE